MRVLGSLRELDTVLRKERLTAVVRVCPTEDTKFRAAMAEAQKVQDVYPALQIVLVKGTVDDMDQEEATAQFLMAQGIKETILMLPHWWIAWRGRVSAIYKQSGAIVRDLLAMFGGKDTTAAVVDWIEKMLQVERGTGQAKRVAPNRASSPDRVTDPSRNRRGPPSPFEVLGLHPSANMDEIRKAYRTLCARYHPDKVAHLGQAQQDAAHRKIVEINAAYEKLKVRG
jgi:hypothetical protein